MAAPQEPRPARTLRIEVAPRTLGWVIVLIASIWLLQRLWPIVMVITVALIFVGTMAPVVQHLEEKRRFKRDHALALVFLALVIATSLLLLLTLPPLASQFVGILTAAPLQQAHLATWLDGSKLMAPLAPMVRGAGSEQLITWSGNHLVAYSSQVIEGIGYGVTTIFLSFYLMADGKRVKGALFAVVPRDYHLRLANILFNLETIVGGYMRGQLITSACITVFTFILLSFCQVNNSLALAVFAGLTDVLPFVGGLLAITPAVVGALPQGFATAMTVFISMLVYQEFESRVLVPRVYGHVLRLSAAIVILALLTGGMLMGILGALLALPIAAGLQMIIRELRVDMPGDDSSDVKLRAREERAERVYESLSSGTLPEDAAVIATDLAQEIRQADAALPVPAPTAIPEGPAEHHAGLSKDDPLK